MTEASPSTRLREQFRPEHVGKLPQPMKKDSPKGKCKPKNEGGDAPGWQDYYCGGYHGLPAIHLDYVGHAAVTDRLLEVDPSWNWEPVSIDDRGCPALDASNNLWIRLTVLGVTRLGVGDGQNMKERIGDALRNAAMRFGVALDLWIKGSEEAARTVTTSVAETGPSSDEQAARAALVERFVAIPEDKQAALIDWIKGSEGGFTSLADIPPSWFDKISSIIAKAEQQVAPPATAGSREADPAPEPRATTRAESLAAPKPEGLREGEEPFFADTTPAEAELTDMRETVAEMVKVLTAASRKNLRAWAIAQGFAIDETGGIDVAALDARSAPAVLDFLAEQVKPKTAA